MLSTDINNLHVFIAINAANGLSPQGMDAVAHALKDCFERALELEKNTVPKAARMTAADFASGVVIPFPVIPRDEAMRR